MRQEPGLPALCTMGKSPAMVSHLWACAANMRAEERTGFERALWDLSCGPHMYLVGVNPSAAQAWVEGDNKLKVLRDYLLHISSERD